MMDLCEEALRLGRILAQRVPQSSRLNHAPRTIDIRRANALESTHNTSQARVTRIAIVLGRLAPLPTKASLATRQSRRQVPDRHQLQLNRTVDNFIVKLRRKTARAPRDRNTS
jgi:hypothetical protein